MKICHIISGLNVGGAEIVLSKLLASKISSACVISLTNIGKIGKDIQSMGYEVYSLNLTVFNFPIVLFRLVKIIKKYNPTIVQTWLYHADFFGGIAARFAGVTKIVWGIRTTNLKKGLHSTPIIRRLCAYLSYFIPVKIILVAEAARIEHIRIGYNADIMKVINNGFTRDNLNMSTSSRNKLREIFSIKKDDLIIGCVGRLSQIKGQDIFIKATGLVLRRYPKVKFLMVGQGLTDENKLLVSFIRQHSNQKNFILGGERSDVIDIYKLMDIFCLPSRGEGFPNVLGEAMISGIPCISSNVGDVLKLGGKDVLISKVGDFDDLAQNIIKLLELSHIQRKNIGKSLQKRIIKDYSSDKMVSEYKKLYIGLRN